jgi:uncharacterized metal-binding protein YceD (DUF177 family)
MFKIFINEIQHQSLLIEERLPPSFMNIMENDLQFNDPIIIQGHASITDNYILLQINLLSYAIMPCSICNKPTKVKINLKNLSLTEDLANVKESFVDFSSQLREAILLELPHFIECDGLCKERKNINKYLTKDKNIIKKMNFPFADLHLK